VRTSFCTYCGSPIARPGRRRETSLLCPECGQRIGLQPAVFVAAVLARRGGDGPEVLLVRRAADAAQGPGLYGLPGRTLHWGEDAREAAALACHDQTGVKVVVVAAYDVHSDFQDPEALAVSSYFRVRPRDGDDEVDPVAGADAELADFFPLARLPELASANDRLVLDRLAAELGKLAGDGESTPSPEEEASLAARLDRRRQRYRSLLDAYTEELMRGAWVNELHLRLSSADSPSAIASVAAEHIASRREVDEARVWFPGPPDRCERCPWRDRCPRLECLHLVADVHGPEPDSDFGAVVTIGDDPGPEGPSPEDQRIPFLKGHPTADAALQVEAVQAELPGAGAQPIRFHGFPLQIEEGHPGVLGLISRTPIDPNARRLFEVVARHVAALVHNARLVEDLRAANNVKRSFIARLSHELKTPLTAILSFAELLREELQAAGNDLGADGAATIEAEGRKLLGILETILEIAKLESGAVALRPERVSLTELLEERLPPWQERARSKGVEFTLVTVPEGESDVVWADRGRVRQVLDELLSNAVKFTQSGKIEVSLLPDAEQVACQVTDTGIGIPRESYKQIFEVFAQGSEGIHLEYGGLGLGLALAKTLVEMQGGRIWVDSFTGQGSSFFFALPRSAPLG